MSEPLATIIIIFLIFWISILSVFVLRMIRHYNMLTQGATPAGLKDVLTVMIQKHSETRSSMKAIEQKMEDLRVEGKHHFQKIGLVRFNPFADTGGSQSFTLALLDGNNTGLVITSLYARAGNRWYIKEVVSGKGTLLELSREEQTAIKEAQKTV